MSTENIKICLQCGAEYSASAQVCADCGGKLVFPRGHEIEPLSEDDAKILLREGSVDYLRELERELRSNAIRTAIVLHAPAAGT